MTDASGTPQATITYDGYGNVLSDSNSSFTDRYLYTGRELDSVTGLQYNRAQYYDPTVGRWTQEDPLGFAAGDENLYRYTSNSPVDFRDPNGMDKIDELRTQLGDRDWKVRDKAQTDLRRIYLFSPSSLRLYYNFYYKHYKNQPKPDPEVLRRLQAAFEEPMLPPPPSQGQILLNILKQILGGGMDHLLHHSRLQLCQNHRALQTAGVSELSLLACSKSKLGD